MKTALFYSIVLSYGGARVLVVTTEKHSQYHGRWLDTQEATHVRKSDAHGRLETAEEALARRDAVRDLKEREAEELRPLHEAQARVWNKYRQLVEEALS